MSVPSWWTWFLLTVAAFRIYRLIAMDTLLDIPRGWLVGLGGWREGQPVPAGYRQRLAEFLVCPWCLGFWICGALLSVFCATTEWLDWFGFAVTWLAMSAGVGLLAQLDPGE